MPASPPPLAMPFVAPSIPIVNVRPIGAMGSQYTQQEPPQNTYVPLVQGTWSQAPSTQNFGASSLPVRPQRPNYGVMSDQQRGDVFVQFSAKYGILQTSFPAWNIVPPPTTWTLDQVHDDYEAKVKQIIVSLNCNQWKVYLVIMFLAIEAFGIKVLGLDFRGFTMSQVKIMQRYDQVLVELGEKYYVQGASNWPIEARIMMMAGFNGVIFIAVKYLSKWLGGDAMSGNLQGFVDQFLGGGNLFSAGTQQRDQFGIPVVPGTVPNAATAQEGGPVPSTEAANPLGALGGMFSNFMNQGTAGGAPTDMSTMLANLGNMFTSNMKPATPAEASTEAKDTPTSQTSYAPRKAPPRARPMFA